MIQDSNSRPPSLFLIRIFYYLVVLSLFIALLTNQLELTFLGCIIVGMVFSAKTWSRLSLKKVQYDLSIPVNRMFPGDSLKIAVRFENAKMLPIWLQLRVNMDSRLRPTNGDPYLSKETWVLSYQTAHLSFRLPARKRGVYTIGPFEIQGGDLLGFFSNRQIAPKTFQAVVYPRVTQIKTIDLPRHDFFGTSGAKHPVEDPIYLLGTRDYQHRRPAKFIHWKASARLNRLQEKLCEPSSREKVLLSMDVATFEKNDASDAFERMLDAAASMAVQMHHRGCAVGLMTNGKTFEDVPGVVPCGYGTRQLTTILETMARLEMRATEKIIDVLTSGIGPTAGVSFAHFSYLCGAETRKLEGIFNFYNLTGAFFIVHRSDAPETNADKLPSNYHYMGDVWI